ncbi:pentatricopeptide repeat-containing protein At3g26782, mitochondrial [Cryptomeria japonica]|uniref:pentatricopeptide repeat-containing protein At3g26782, mitochondrial n=1 Tax=Cryptomeria japonica TaxID=3369 RepID=UPI0027D9FADF|nr:pentatricopeptide repeat-containing protein At3g26782, mitochondrial [Cryptomeria japonica]
MIMVECIRFHRAISLLSPAHLRGLKQPLHIHFSQFKRIHSVITHTRSTFLRNKLINMYAKCGNLGIARQVFDGIAEPDLISWNVIIVAYQRQGYSREALTLFHQMQRTGIHPDQFILASILPACAAMGALEAGLHIHHRVIESGFLSDVVVINALIDMYVKCESIFQACKLFENMPQRNVVSWTVMIAGYAQNGFVKNALETYKTMKSAGVKANSTTFASILPACAKIGALERGMEFHQIIFQSGFLSDIVLANALIDMYAKCGSMQKARQMFDKMSVRDAVTWNTMMAGYALDGFAEEALETFKLMQLAGVQPDSTTFASVLPTCAKLGALEEGMNIHQMIMESKLLLDVVVVSALIDMYAKCGCLHKARNLFDEMPRRNVISWTAMISGYAQNGVLDEALRLFKEMPSRNVVTWTVMIAGYAQNGFIENALETFKQMQLAGINPNSTTYASILPAIAKMGALEEGMVIHQRIIESGFFIDISTVNALIDMYAKCGSIHKARKVFNKIPERNVVSWNMMIAGYARHGYGKHSLKIFELMKDSGTYADNVSFICVLFACSHAGLVDEGCKFFCGMSDSYCIMPTMDHYACMVDLLGRASYLDEALNLIIKMPFKPAVVAWMCLLGACRSHKNIELGVFTATLLFELDPTNDAVYVLLADIYAEVSRWDDVQKVRGLMNDRGIKKIPGCSWIEIREVVHAFCVGDRSHPQTHEIYTMLQNLTLKMKASGYMPYQKHTLNDVEEEEKELFLCHHSEKLAIAFGLLNTSPGTTIRVVKNLRVCVECHNATKFISKIVAREIVVRDANRFHHFNQGQCSCGDYW